MNTKNILTIDNSRCLTSQFSEVYYEQDNGISDITIKLPDSIGNYSTANCTIEMHAILPSGDYLAYNIPTDNKLYNLPIGVDLTEKTQTVQLLFKITSGETVVGRTNAVPLTIHVTSDGLNELTPRAEFDEVISEQRQTIQEQGETITQQGETITQQGEQITELNGEVTELTTENTRLEALTASQRQEIDYLVNNPPALEYPENPVIPTRQAQTIRPTPPFYGIGRLEVDGYTPNNQNKTVTPTTTEQTVTAGESYDGLGVVTVEPTPLESKTVTPTSEEITYTPTTPNIGFSSVTVEEADIPLGGIYFTELDENNTPVGFKIVNYDFNSQTFSLPNVRGIDIETIIFQNCQKCVIADTYFNGSTKLRAAMLDGVIQTGTNSFMNCTNLVEVTLFDGISVLGTNTFFGCRNLSTITIPASLTSIMIQAFYNCTALQNVTIENGFNCNNLNLSASTLYSHDTILSWFNALADRTGETAYTLTMGTTNLNKLTAEQKAIATNKNWNLA